MFRMRQADTVIHEQVESNLKTWNQDRHVPYSLEKHLQQS